MRISREELERRLGSQKNLSASSPSGLSASSGPEGTEGKESKGSVTHIQKQTPRRGKEFPKFLKELAGDLGRAGIPQRAVGEVLGMSKDTVSDAERGYSGTNGNDPPTLEKRAEIAAKRHGIQDIALTKLMGSLGLIDDRKLSDLGPKDLSQVASNLSKVVHQMTEQSQAALGAVNVTIYAPHRPKESNFKVIDVG